MTTSRVAPSAGIGEVARVLGLSRRLAREVLGRRALDSIRSTPRMSAQARAVRVLLASCVQAGAEDADD